MGATPLPEESELLPAISGDGSKGDRLPRQRGFGWSVVSVMRGTVVGQAIAVASTPLVSRLFSPAVFGDFALIVSVAAAVSTLAGLRYETAIPLCESDNDAAATVAVATSAVLLVALLALIGALVAFERPLLLGNVAVLRDWLLIVPVLVVLTGASQVLSYTAIRNKQFEQISWFRVNQALPVAAFQILLGYAVSRHVGSLIVASVVGQMIACGLLARSVLRHPAGRALGGVSLERMRRVFVRFRNFPLFMTPYGLVSIGRERMIYLLLGVFSSTSVVGIYALAYRLTLLPINLLSSSLSPVVFQRASAAADVREVEGLIDILLTWLVRLSVPAFMLFVLAAYRLAGAVLGPAWKSVGSYAAVLAVPAWFMLHTTWLDRMLDRLNRQRLALAIETGYTVVALTGVTIALRATKDGLTAVATFAAITTVYNVVWLVMLYRVAKFSMRTLVHRGIEALGLAAACVLLLGLLTILLPATVAFGAGAAAVIGYEVLCFRRAYRSAAL